MKKLFLATLFLLITSCPVTYGQALALNIDAPPDLVVSVNTDGVLDFGNLMQDQGLVQIPLEDANTEIITITGFLLQRVHVTITPPPALQLNASNSLPFTLRAAYANHGEENKSQAEPFNDNTASFRIYTFPGWNRGNRGRGGMQANGIPDFLKQTAYVYIYGSIEVGPNVRAGTYTGIINISVE